MWGAPCLLLYVPTISEDDTENVTLGPYVLPAATKPISKSQVLRTRADRSPPHPLFESSRALGELNLREQRRLTQKLWCSPR